MFQGNQIILKHFELQPSYLRVTNTESVKLKIGYDNEHSMSQIGSSRIFFFVIEQIDEQIGPLKEGQTFTLDPFLKTGTYNLVCINYPKIKSIIQVNDFAKVLPMLSQLAQVKQQQKQDDIKYQQSAENEQENQILNKNSQIDSLLQPQKNPKQAKQLQQSQQEIDYDKILESESEEQSIKHVYLKEFKRQFQVWRKFFAPEVQPQKTPQKPSSAEIQLSNPVRPSSAMSNCISNFDIGSPVKASKSINIQLYSHQGFEGSSEPQINSARSMKKTSSEYLPAKKVEERQILKTQSQADTFIDWAINWSIYHQTEPVNIVVKQQHHVVRQYLAYLHNQFEISKFLYD